MNILELQVFVSLMLVAGGVLLFVFTVRARTFEHADRLALAPLEDDLAPPSAASFSDITDISAPPSISSAAAELPSSVARTPKEGQ